MQVIATLIDSKVIISNTSKYILLVIALLVVSISLSLKLTTGQDNPEEHLPSNSKPNIILILADDAGYADFGFMGSLDILSPNLDQLAADGVIFTDAHVTASVCSPSRAGILAGRYQQRFGHECNLEPNQGGAFDSSQVTIAEFLSDQGYNTSIFGKWHLGEKPHQHPLENGFDYFWGFLAGSRSYFPNDIQDKEGNNHAILENHTPTNFDGYLTDVIGQKAVEYIEKSKSDTNPFFMYLSFNAPHTPMHAKDDVVKKFGSDHQRPVYAAMIWSMDEAVGRVVETLKSQGKYENTLIFFLSDNGGAHNNGSSVGALKGWKGNQYEGGTRVPFVVTWKKQIESGRKFAGLTSSLDIYGTVASLWNYKGYEGHMLDGVDLLPFLNLQAKGDPHETLYWRKDEMASIRVNDYKYITLQDSLSVMYDLKNDIAENTNIQSKYQEVADNLHKSLMDWEQTLENPLWLEPDQWNLVTRIIYQDLMNNQPANIKEPADMNAVEQ